MDVVARLKLLWDMFISNPMQEGVTMASMDHPYVVRLFGISMGRKMMLVSQFVPLGSLLDFLRKHKERLNAKNMLTFGHQIAEVCKRDIREFKIAVYCANSKRQIAM